MKSIFIMVFSVFLLACDSDNTAAIVITPPVVMDVDLNADDDVVTGFYDDSENLTVSGSRKSVTIVTGSVLGDVVISGSNNLMTIEASATLNSFAFTGDDNTLSVPLLSGITVDSDTGSGNTITTY